MLDCLHGFGLEHPQEPLFESLASAGKSHISLKIMVSLSRGPLNLVLLTKKYTHSIISLPSGQVTRGLIGLRLFPSMFQTHS